MPDGGYYLVYEKRSELFGKVLKRGALSRGHPVTATRKAGEESATRLLVTFYAEIDEETFQALLPTMEVIG